MRAILQSILQKYHLQRNARPVHAYGRGLSARIRVERDEIVREHRFVQRANQTRQGCR
jgi:hypothetical protein